MDNKTFESNMKNRMLAFSVAVIRMAEKLPEGYAGDIIGRQLIRSASSVGANYRAACLGRSRADFLSKISIAQEGADESQYWLEMLAALDKIDGENFKSLHGESRELTAILTTSIKTIRSMQKN